MSCATVDPFLLSNRLRAFMRDNPHSVSTLKVSRNTNIYNCGDHDQNVYLIESGQVKALTLSPDGKECVVSIYVANDIFGELCLLGSERMETATAMKTTVLKRIPRDVFLQALADQGLVEDFIKYLVLRLSEQQQTITNLVTMNSEQRLASTLLQLARKIGKQDPCGLRVEERITQEELSEMVGTTRSRIGYFLKRFSNMGLIQPTPESFFIVNEKRLCDYVDARA